MINNQETILRYFLPAKGQEYWSDHLENLAQVWAQVWIRLNQGPSRLLGKSNPTEIKYAVSFLLINLYCICLLLTHF